jgi:hypothetical protein
LFDTSAGNSIPNSYTAFDLWLDANNRAGVAVGEYYYARVTSLTFEKESEFHTIGILEENGYSRNS